MFVSFYAKTNLAPSSYINIFAVEKMSLAIIIQADGLGLASSLSLNSNSLTLDSSLLNMPIDLSIFRHFVIY